MNATVNGEHLRRDIVVVGASAGGVRGLERLLSKLPAGFPGTIGIVLHRSPLFASRLAWVWKERTGHEVSEPEHGTPLEPGHVYLAPPDRHMTFGSGTILLDRGPKQHYTRPAADPLFQSAARSYGPRVVGVVVSGGGDDGVAGLKAIKASGGISIAQNPAEAAVAFMPYNAIQHDDVDLVLDLDRIAMTLAALADGRPVPATDATTAFT